MGKVQKNYYEVTLDWCPTYPDKRGYYWTCSGNPLETIHFEARSDEFEKELKKAIKRLLPDKDRRNYIVKESHVISEGLIPAYDAAYNRGLV